jgi:hypothetical protein
MRDSRSRTVPGMFQPLPFTQNYDLWVRSARAIDASAAPPHSEKRAGVRDPRFRQLSRTEQEELAGTSWDVLATVYDDLSEEDLRDAVRRLETG